MGLGMQCIYVIIFAIKEKEFRSVVESEVNHLGVRDGYVKGKKCEKINRKSYFCDVQMAYTHNAHSIQTRWLP